MATKLNLAAVTPVGTFTRLTGTQYSHVVVWNSPRAFAAAKTENANNSGVHARWAKDKGFGVTWHGTEAAARQAARKGYLWDGRATLVGVFEVKGN